MKRNQIIDEKVKLNGNEKPEHQVCLVQQLQLHCQQLDLVKAIDRLSFSSIFILKNSEFFFEKKDLNKK